MATHYAAMSRPASRGVATSLRAVCLAGISVSVDDGLDLFERVALGQLTRAVTPASPPAHVSSDEGSEDEPLSTVYYSSEEDDDTPVSTLLAQEWQMAAMSEVESDDDLHSTEVLESSDDEDDMPVQYLLERQAEAAAKAAPRDDDDEVEYES